MFSNDKGTFAQHYAEQMNKSNKLEQPKTDEEMRNREMDADPMRDYFREKERIKTGSSSAAGSGDKAKVYSKPYPPNRYNIRPGHRWDGVDRSNGHEAKLLERENQFKAREEESYRNATRDL